MKNRIGLLGGTFNPVHLGHIELGQKIQDSFGLDRIFYILSARPPHKRAMVMPPAATRFKMLQKALEPYPELVPCDIEMKRDGLSWTIDTVAELKKLNPGSRFFFISGSEGFLNIRTWKNYRELLKSLSFIVVLRKEGSKMRVENLLSEENIPWTEDIDRPGDHPGVYIYAYDSPRLSLSSTLIRERIKEGQAIGELVGEEVKKIMEENRLYENEQF